MPAMPGTYDHYSGVCAMRNDDLATVDSRLKVCGAAGLGVTTHAIRGLVETGVFPAEQVVGGAP